MRKAESLQRELEMLGEATSSEHCAALFSYTVEEPDLYRKLNHAYIWGVKQCCETQERHQMVSI